MQGEGKVGLKNEMQVAGWFYCCFMVVVGQVGCGRLPWQKMLEDMVWAIAKGCGNECKVVALARQVFLFYPMLLDTAEFSKMVQWPSEVLSERTWLVMYLLVANFKTQSQAKMDAVRFWWIWIGEPSQMQGFYQWGKTVLQCWIPLYFWQPKNPIPIASKGFEMHNKGVVAGSFLWQEMVVLCLGQKKHEMHIAGSVLESVWNWFHDRKNHDGGYGQLP